MIKGKLIHPEILGVLGTAGHGATILIADGNYPFATHGNPQAKRVYLNLMPGMLKVTEVLEAIISDTTVEAAHVMVPADDSEPAIFAEFRQQLGDLELSKLGRFDFYVAARQDTCCLVVATGEQRIYANILLTIGVIPPA